MKKYDYSRVPAMPAGRKKKFRKKASFSFLKPLSFFIVFILLCFAAYVGVSRAYDAFSSSRAGKWTPKTIQIHGAEGALAKELKADAEPKLNVPFSLKDAASLRKSLKQKYPQLGDISVRRGLFSGALKVSVKRRQPVAKFVLPGGAVRYIDEEGNVYPDPTPDPQRSVPFVELEGNIPENLGGEFVDLVQSALKLKAQLDFAFLRFNTDADTVRMHLPDGCVILFGPAKNLRQKARRAAQIEESAAKGAYPHPHELDFTYFDDGKVFLRQAAH